MQNLKSISLNIEDSNPISGQLKAGNNQHKNENNMNQKMNNNISDSRLNNDNTNFNNINNDNIINQSFNKKMIVIWKLLI